MPADTIRARQGWIYIGGGSRLLGMPSPDAIREWAADKGFDSVVIYSRNELPRRPDGSTALPFPIPPGDDPEETDDWDVMVQARRAAPDADMEIPSRVRWIVEVPPDTKPPELPPPSNEPPPPAAKPPILKPPAGGVPAPATPPPTTPPTTALKAIGVGLSILGTGLGSYHGYKRNRSVAWALVWAIGGGVAPVIAIPMALAQGFGKREGTS